MYAPTLPKRNGAFIKVRGGMWSQLNHGLPWVKAPWVCLDTANRVGVSAQCAAFKPTPCPSECHHRAANHLGHGRITEDRVRAILNSNMCINFA